jgi:hypothetical protein
MRRLLLLLIALPAAPALRGCERLCAPYAAGKKVGVFCPEDVDETRSITARGRGSCSCIRRPVRASSPNRCCERTRSRPAAT